MNMKWFIESVYSLMKQPFKVHLKKISLLKLESSINNAMLTYINYFRNLTDLINYKIIACI